MDSSLRYLGDWGSKKSGTRVNFSAKANCGELKHCGLRLSELNIGRYVFTPAMG